ncbi:MAG: DUF1439 domain-containing protein [Psychromonas sp.]
MLRSLFVIALLSFSQLSFSLPYTLKITEQELQKKLDAQLPIERKNNYLTAKIYDSTVELIEGTDQIAVFSNLDVNILGSFQGSGSAYVKGEISYEPSEGAFYIQNPTIVTLKVDDIPEEFLPEIQKMAQLSLQKAALHYPVFKLNQGDIEHKMAKAMLESIEVKEQTLLIKLNTP